MLNEMLKLNKMLPEIKLLMTNTLLTPINKSGSKEYRELIIKINFK